MKFCPKCGSALIVERKERAYRCPRCGYEESMEGGILYQRSTPETDKIVVVGEEERNLRTMPQVTIECPKCGNNKAYWWMVQTRGIDESTTQFYRCTKCGYTWREYT